MKKSKFIKYPEYPGGKTEFRKYFHDHLSYPEEALKHQIEGDVFLSAEIDDNGNIHDIRIEKGLGYGCDEEAVRLLNGLHFGGVTNPGIRLKTKKKFRIPFRIKKEKEIPNLKYSVKKDLPENKTTEHNSGNKVYSYTIPWNTNSGNQGQNGVSK